MNIQSTLNIKGVDRTINCQIHFRPSVENYQLNPDDFYLKEGNEKLKGRGYEIEILNYSEILDWHEKERKFLRDGKLSGLHVHMGDDVKPYVCYPLQIKTKKDAIRLHKEWCRVMFIQIFFGLSDSFLANETQSDDTTVWANFIDKYLEHKNLKIEDSL